VDDTYLRFHGPQVPDGEFANPRSVRFSSRIRGKQAANGTARELQTLRTASHRHNAT